MTSKLSDFFRFNLWANRTLLDACAALDESQLEEQWVKPVLDTLSLYFSVQVKIRYREAY